MTHQAATPRLLLLHPSDEMYGADKVFLETITALRDHFSLEVWLPDDVEYPKRQLSQKLTEEGIEWRYKPLPAIRRKDLNLRGLAGLTSRFFKIHKALRSETADLIYVNTTALTPAVVASRMLGIRSVLHIHEYLGDKLGKLLMWPASMADAAIAVSQSISADFTKRLKKKTVVIHNGFDIPPPSAEEASVNTSKENVTFLLASRWNPWKGHKQFLSAWDSLPNPPGNLRVLGGPPAAGISVDVEGIVAEMYHSDSVEIVGEQSEVQAELVNADIIVVPSTRPDPLPTIAIESLAAGRPVLASECGGLPEIVLNGTTGWIVPAPASVAVWAKHILDSSAKHTTMEPASCRERFESMFTQERYQRSVRELFEALLPHSEISPQSTGQ